MVAGTQVRTGQAKAHAIRLGGREIPVLIPSRSDPRLRLAMVIVSLQVLRQTVLHFKPSIAQISAIFRRSSAV